MLNLGFLGMSDTTITVRCAPDEESGKYAIGEVALINVIDDEEYVSSTGVAFRKDEMPREVRKSRDKARRDAKKSKKED